MQCPLCINESLDVMVRGEIEIDVCPRCRGVWLDRGEIDKLAGTGRVKPVRPRRPDAKRYDNKRYADKRSDRDRKGRDDDDDRDRKRREQRKRRKKNFAERLADAIEDIID